MELLDVIANRRAYRSLDPVEINEPMIRDLAAAASLSASCFNNQPWRFVSVIDPAVLRELSGVMSKNNDWTRAASMVVAVVSRRDLDCLVKGREYFLFDSGMATAFLILRATEMGLVAHPIAGFDDVKAKEILRIPADMTLITLVIVGRHASKRGPLLTDKQAEAEKQRPTRKPLEEIMRINHF